MTETIFWPVGIAASYLAPTLLWAILAEDAWRFRVVDRPRSPFYRLLPWLTTSLTALWALFLAFALLLPIESDSSRPPLWSRLTDVALLSSVAIVHHTAWHFRLDAPRPSPVWLAVNYGSATLIGLVNLVPEVVAGPTLGAKMAVPRVVLGLYVVAMLLSSYRLIRRHARPGAWRPGSTSVARQADVVIFAGTTIAALGVFAFLAFRKGVVTTAGYAQPPPIVTAATGVAVALPFAVRILGDVVKRLLFVALVLASTAAAGGAVAFVALGGADGVLPQGARMPTAYALLTGFVIALLGAQQHIRLAIDHLVSRRARRLEAELRRFMQSLSPELGPLECCRRTLAELARVLRLRGGAILLTRGRGTIAHGEIDVGVLERVWRDEAVATLLLEPPFSLETFRELPVEVREALDEAEIVAALPIASPRQHWGVAFGRTGALGASFGPDERRAVHAAADQLALILDGAELLERALAVERSLAHAEKLAAIGELAARVAHEIRNPVTAARSLAQLLLRDPSSQDTAEHAGLILAELERVERQIAALLRFARRDELRVEPVDLGELARETVEQLKLRLDAAGISVEVDAPSGIVARADREKVRQVLINVVENSLDALLDVAGERRLQIGVSANRDVAALRVADNGPGVDAELLPRLFEPFFSLKSQGTGLGLAIVKRTVEAHGGRVTADRPGRGLELRVELPLASQPGVAIKARPREQVGG